MAAPLRRPTLPLSAAFAGLCAVLLLACSPPRTDREHYPRGDVGQVTLHNDTGATIWLAGCSRFEYQQQVGDEWVSRDPERVCVWEGFAEPLTPDAFATDALDTDRAPGVWRVRYPVGLECRADAPLAEAHCAALVEVASHPFEIGEGGCAIGGCSGQLCVERGGEWVSTCEFLPQYACYRKARCGRFGPGGSCAWEPTPELAACLADPPGWPVHAPVE